MPNTADAPAHPQPEPVKASANCPVCKSYCECIAPADGVNPDQRWCVHCGTLMHQGGRWSCPADQEVPLLIQYIRNNPLTFHHNPNIIRAYAGLPLVREGGAE